MKNIALAVQRWFVVVAVAGGLSVAGCVGPTVTDADLSEDQKDLRTETSTFDSQTVFEGAAAGAATGALVGFIASGGDWQQALVGAAMGAAAGGAIGYAIADQNAEYAKLENQLDKLIADAEFRTTRLASLQSQAEGVLASDKKKLADLQAQIDAKTISKDDALLELAIIRDDLRVIDEAVAAANKHTEVLNENVASYTKEDSTHDASALQEKVTAYEQAASNFSSAVDSTEMNTQLIQLEELMDDYEMAEPEKKA